MNQPNAENTIKNDTPLRTYNVKYVFDSNTLPKNVAKVSFQLFNDGFLIFGQSFPRLWIPYGTVCDFKITNEVVSLIHRSSLDYINERVVQIEYIDDKNQKSLAKLLMPTGWSVFTANIGYKTCKELVSYMKSNGIFDKFISQEQTDLSADIMEQIAKLAELHKSGALSDEEFQSKKAELLGRI